MKLKLCKMSLEKPRFDSAFKDPIDLEVTEDLTEPWKTISRELLNEQDGVREKKIEEFLEKLKADPEVKKWNDPGDVNGWESREHLIRFLRAGNWDENAALAILREHLQSGKLYTSIVRLAVPNKLDKVWAKRLSAVTEYRDVYGRRIFIYRPGAWNPDEIDVNELFASSYVMFELMANEIKNQIAGVTCVCDLQGFGFKHLRSFGLEQVKCVTSFMSGSFPLWIRRIHVVNAPRLFAVLYNMMQPFMDERMKNNMIFHGSDYTQLHKEVPPFLLTSSMGGTQKKLDNDVSVDMVIKRNHIYEALVQKTLKHC